MLAASVIRRLPWPVVEPGEDDRWPWPVLRVADRIVHAFPDGLGHDLGGVSCWCNPHLLQACPGCMGRGEDIQASCPHCLGVGLLPHTLADLDGSRDILVNHNNVSIAALN